MEKTNQIIISPKQSTPIKQAWNFNKKLDRVLVVLQTLFFLTFSYRSNSVIWVIFIVVLFLCFFSLPLIYLTKFVKGNLLNARFKELADQGQIPKWIPRRRTWMYLSWLLAGNPIIWIFFSVISLSFSSVAPWFVCIILLIPWVYIEWKDKKEYSYIEKFVT
jgi:hypothetical protein